ncbi:MAG: DMT family transporter [Anaerolineae bacterium]
MLTSARLKRAVRGKFWAAPALIASVFFWSASFTWSKLALQEVNPWSLAFWRWLIAALFFAAYLPLSGQGPQVRLALRRDGGRLLLLSLLGVSLLYGLQNIGLTRTSAIHSSLIMNAIGLFTALLGVFWLGERLSGRGWLGLALAFGGVILIVWQGAAPAAGVSTLAGDLITLAAALCAALYSIYGKPLVGRTPPAVMTGLVAGFGALCLLPVAAWQGLTIPAQPGTWLLLLALGIGSSALANLAWWQILARMDASRAGIFLFLIPVIASLIAVITLGESLGGQTLAGAVFVLGGLYLAR